MKALILLRKQDLENVDREADNEIESDWDVLTGDGLGDETSSQYLIKIQKR